VSFPVDWEDPSILRTDSPEKRLLPKPAMLRWYDPDPLGGFGTDVPAVAPFIGAARCSVRQIGLSLEATLRRPEVFGVVLLDSITPDAGAPCALVLDVYNDDKETIKWTVGTSPTDPFAYLVEPEDYAQQEIDVGVGSSTVGTVTVIIIDPATNPADKQSRWMTAKLADLGIPDIQGRRCRLRRFISDALGYTVIADGPAGTPTMDDSYAAYSFTIRDTRDVERKLTAFTSGFGRETGGPEDGFDPTGLKSLVPDGVAGGYGHVGSSYLISPATPITGTWHYDSRDYAAPPGSNQVTPAGIIQPVTGFISFADSTLSDAVQTAIRNATVLGGEVLVTYPIGGGHFVRDTGYNYLLFKGLKVIWRDATTPEAWHVITDENLVQVGFHIHPDGSADTRTQLISATIAGRPGDGDVIAPANYLQFGDLRYTPNWNPLPGAPEGTGGAGDLPAEGQNIEIMLLYVGAPSADLPLYLEGMTVGELTKDLYDGVYSDRTVLGAVRPTGILYDEDALLAMTEVVRARITAPVDDMRDWLEKSVYAPTGRAPALDRLGQVSPVSQIPPTDTSDLQVISDSVAEASADWNAGERLVNIVRFTYPRDYKPSDETQTDPDGLVEISVVDEFDDEPSIDRNGEQVVEIVAPLFTAVGDDIGHPRNNDETQELGNQLAQDRGKYLINRYSYGAPTITVAVRRAATVLLRNGDWVLLDLSWLPDYVTNRRGLLALGQIVSLGDLDCAWRQLLIEQVSPITEEYS
jgi:hypothetical protein